ncbi:alkaline phosphatase D family protein [Pontivivens insulae]|uniref:PhoD-like phosphatase domain-containing protein n=1 Tax=Pontivivens insulae TaxID=1639689 RepID=A0A2R8A820_9RHOB|nr:alkaline phosphatase D family protein [Pontivivens insulae]RED18448.1 PhoD-like phosphatase [Pontivivens insulae]SPF28346.1 hypothetical protein POI8812_00644 [Pontivivens insulae]
MTTNLRAGPFLFARKATAEKSDIAIVAALSNDSSVPIVRDSSGQVIDPTTLYKKFGVVILRWEVSLPTQAGAHYTFNETVFDVATDLTSDVRVAYASCNGEEDEDPDWSEEDRNRLWSRLAQEHAEAPFGLMLHGGDQIYADDILQSHPDIEAWEEADHDDKDGFIWSRSMREAAESHLLNRYLDLYASKDIAHMLARVPSVMMWDDHDIFDGYGSHPNPKQESAVGAGLYAISATMFRLFQQGLAEDEPMPRGGVAFDAPGFSVVAPDLRASRTPERVMDEMSWQWLDAALAERRDGQHCFVMSSVPALGPRLSWVEFILDYVWPGTNQYEDDLRDQWQSRTHRKSWRRFLGMMVREIEDYRQPVTLLSGEIHVATRAEMLMKNGGVLHQLVASGISHTPPGRGYARMLGALAAVGEDPLIGYPITIHPPLGKKHRYISERNYLRLTRRDGKWYTDWEFEESGPNEEMMLTGQLRLDS